MIDFNSNLIETERFATLYGTKRTKNDCLANLGRVALCSSRFPGNNKVQLKSFELHEPQQISGAISSQDIREIAELDDQAHYENALRNILVPRVVGSTGWKNVQNFIVGELKSMGMQVELDSFNDNAPIFGKLNFVNIIGKLNPKADRFLVLSAHYDSKYFRDFDFLAATGSLMTLNDATMLKWFCNRFGGAMRFNA